MKSFEDKNAQLVGICVDSRHALRVWSNSLGGVRHPLLSDFWPHGGVLKSYDLLNEQNGMPQRSLMIIDPEGVVRHTELHQGTLPDPAAVLDALEGLQG